MSAEELRVVGRGPVCGPLVGGITALASLAPEVVNEAERVSHAAFDRERSGASRGLAPATVSRRGRPGRGRGRGTGAA
ncbi:hypothetical protein GCM10009790_04770 [Georgenia ruanii]